MESNVAEVDAIKYMCGECGGTTTSSEALVIHQSDNCRVPLVEKYDDLLVKEETFWCEHCSTTFAEERFLKSHLLTIHDPTYVKSNPPCGPPFQCDFCFKFYPDMKNLNSHLRTHGDKHFSCKHCNLKFKRLALLKQHFVSHAKNNLHVCVTCQEGFSFPDELKAHCDTTAHELPPTEGASITKKTQCSECDLEFLSKEEKLKHKINVHRQAEYGCDICGKKYVMKRNLQLHMKKHKNEGTGEDTQEVFKKKYLCEACDKNFASRSAYVAHNRSVHSTEVPFICDVCGKGFKYIGHLNVHKRIHSDVKQFVCDICGKGFRHKPSLNKHKSAHNNGRLFSCDVCKKTFRHKGPLRAHMEYHTGERPYKDAWCSKGFVKKSYLDAHCETTTHELPPTEGASITKETQCSECDLEFFSKEEKLKHKIKVHRQAEYGCDICGKKYVMKRNLQFHMKKHKNEGTGEDPQEVFKKKHLCEACGRNFASRSACIAHNRSVHSTEVPFICDVCGKRFKFIGHFNVHKRIHLESKQFVCDVCGKEFRYKQSLIEHKGVHNNDRPFSCDVCKKTYRHRGPLRVHMRYHTGERPYKCARCSKGFVRKYYLDAHNSRLCKSLSQ